MTNGDWSDTEPHNNTDRTQSSIELVNRVERLQKQLEIAKNRLLWVLNERISDGYADDGIAMEISQTLTQIEELNK